MNTNTRIVILVFNDVIPRSSSSVADTKTLAQEIARRYQESNDASVAARDSRGMRDLHSPDFKILN